MLTSAEVCCIFEAFGVESLGPWGSGAGIILIFVMRDQNARVYLAERIGITIQHGYAANILGTLVVLLLIILLVVNTSGSRLDLLDYF